jgi:hypothetical protein
LNPGLILARQAFMYLSQTPGTFFPFTTIPHPQAFFVRQGLMVSLRASLTPRSYLFLMGSWDYRQEPLHLAP